MSSSREDLEKLLRDFAVNVLRVPPGSIEPGASLRDDLGLDSIDVFDILAHFTERTGATVSPDDLRGAVTVEDFVEILRRACAEKSAAAGGA